MCIRDRYGTLREVKEVIIKEMIKDEVNHRKTEPLYKLIPLMRQMYNRFYEENMAVSYTHLKKEWDKIPKGTSELYLYLHGGVSCLYFDGSDMNLKELLALKKKKIKKKIVLLSCKGGIGDKNSVAKIMAKKCQCVVYASSYPYGLSYRYDKKKKVYYLSLIHI